MRAGFKPLRRLILVLAVAGALGAAELSSAASSPPRGADHPAVQACDPCTFIWVVRTGSGRVVSNVLTNQGVPIDCGTRCQGDFYGYDVSEIELTAIPSSGTFFLGWEDCPRPSGTNPLRCGVPLDLTGTFYCVKATFSTGTDVAGVCPPPGQPPPPPGPQSPPPPTGGGLPRAEAACGIVGTPGPDILRGTSADDRLCGGGGNDVLYGGGGDDLLRGGAGNDRAYGEEGRDRMIGDGGSDLLAGGGRGDALHGGAGDDRLRGGPHGDLLRGDAGYDVLSGEGGSDRLFGDDGRDLLNGGESGDKLQGGLRSDRLLGGDGSDVLNGGPGGDRLFGAGGADTIMARDRVAEPLDGGPGRDRARADRSDRIVSVERRF